ncbi:exocyst complex component SEC6-like [Tripterygium wilfordii]|uniref:exocyst complex component SEC6-like n=1 Tax=Tripterygium wilfordii TaxID=458696 RepID=UPI0018F7FDBB|nr:exocyst complex component SEC6-like [Tripterygium wilfordii]
MMVEDLGVEAKEAAVREVAKFLPLPDLLQSIFSIKADYIARQQANDAQLSTMVAEQVEQAQTGLESLSLSEKTINMLRENFVAIEMLCQECQNLIENHDQIKLLSNARNNLNTTLKDVEGMMSISVEAAEARDSLSDDKEIVNTYERLTGLDGKRRFALAAASSHKEEIGRLKEYFEDVDRTWETFEKALWGHIANFYKFAKERYLHYFLSNIEIGDSDFFNTVILPEDAFDKALSPIQPGKKIPDVWFNYQLLIDAHHPPYTSMSKWIKSPMYFLLPIAVAVQVPVCAFLNNESAPTRKRKETTHCYPMSPFFGVNLTLLAFLWECGQICKYTGESTSLITCVHCVNFEDTCKGFLEVAKETVLQIVCVIFEDPGVQELLIEIYHKEWCEGLVTEDLVATFGEYFKEVKMYIEERSFRRLVEACLEETVVVYVDQLLKQRNNIKEETSERMRLDEEVITDFFREYLSVSKVESRVRILSDLRELASAERLDTFTLVYANILEHQPDCPPEVVEKLVGLRESIPRKDAKEVIRECKEIYENSMVDGNPAKAGFVFPKVKCLQSSKGSLWRKLT